MNKKREESININIPEMMSYITLDHLFLNLQKKCTPQSYDNIVRVVHVCLPLEAEGDSLSVFISSCLFLFTRLFCFLCVCFCISLKRYQERQSQISFLHKHLKKISGILDLYLLIYGIYIRCYILLQSNVLTRIWQIVCFHFALFLASITVLYFLNQLPQIK